MSIINDLLGACWRALVEHLGRTGYNQYQVKRLASKYHKAKVLRFNTRHRD